MIHFNAERIRQKPCRGVDAVSTMPHYRAAALPAIRPFLPGQVFVVKYGAGPQVCTIVDRTDTTVTWLGGTETLNRFNLRVVCYLGHRASIWGIWLPWVVVKPRVLINDMPESTYNDTDFWKVDRKDLAAADSEDAPEAAGATFVPGGI